MSPKPPAQSGVHSGSARAGRGGSLGPDDETAERTRRPSQPSSARGRRARAEFEHAARELFATRGYFRVTVEDIAKACGRSKAAFYQYFPSREELLMNLSEHFVLEVAARARATGAGRLSDDDGPYFLAQAQAYWDSYVAHRGVMVAVFQLATVDERFAARQTEIRASGQSGIEATIRRAQQHGHGLDLDPVIASAALAVMIEHFCFVMLGHGAAGAPAVNDKAAVEAIAAIWHRALYGEPA